MIAIVSRYWLNLLLVFHFWKAKKFFAEQVKFWLPVDVTEQGGKNQLMCYGLKMKCLDARECSG